MASPLSIISLVTAISVFFTPKFLIFLPVVVSLCSLVFAFSNKESLRFISGFGIAIVFLYAYIVASGSADTLMTRYYMWQADRSREIAEQLERNEKVPDSPGGRPGIDKMILDQTNKTESW